MRKIILINSLFFVCLYLFAERVDLSNDSYFCTINIPNNIVLNNNIDNKKNNTNKGNLLDITSSKAILSNKFERDFVQYNDTKRYQGE